MTGGIQSRQIRVGEKNCKMKFAIKSNGRSRLDRIELIRLCMHNARKELRNAK